jgi:hypothetical protein
MSAGARSLKMKYCKTFLLTAAFILVARGAAGACVCFTTAETQTPEQARAALVKDYNGARAVFAGRVVALDALRVRFKLDKVWKGDLGDELLMSTGAIDNGDGTHTATSCDFEFVAGREYLVFAYGESAEKMQAQQCTRTRLLQEAARDVKDLDEVWPHERRPAAPPDPVDP